MTEHVGAIKNRLSRTPISGRCCSRPSTPSLFVLVPAGTHHNVVKSSKTALLKLYTIYAPPNHPAGTVHKTKAEAEDAELAEALRVEYCTDIKD